MWQRPKQSQLDSQKLRSWLTSAVVGVACNSRFCMYPQELLFKLEHPSKIQQIQLLSHEYKVGRVCLCRIGRW